VSSRSTSSCGSSSSSNSSSSRPFTKSGVGRLRHARLHRCGATRSPPSAPGPGLAGLEIKRLHVPDGPELRVDDGAAAGEALPPVPPVAEWGSDPALMAG
jgi:hypothetical protein